MSAYEDDIAPYEYVIDQHERKMNCMAKTKQLGTKKAPRRAAKKRTTTKRRGTYEGKGFLGKSPLALILFGPSGVGKTTWASCFPNVGFMHDPQEDGIVRLPEWGQIESPKVVECVENFSQSADFLASVAAGDVEIDTLVLDSLTGFQHIIFEHHCQDQFQGDWSKEGFMAFQQGPINASETDVPLFIDLLRDVNKAGINVIILAHSKIKTFDDPTGPAYDRFIPVCQKDVWQKFHRWAGGVLFYNYSVDVEKRKGAKSKAQEGSEHRFIQCQWSPLADAKNQYGLPPVIEAGSSHQETYDAFIEAFQGESKKRRKRK